jgi:hypothetical protein
MAYVRICCYLMLALNVFREQWEDAMNLGETSYETSTTNGMWMHHAQDASWGTRPSKHNIRFAGSPIVFRWKGHTSSIQSAIEIHEHLMESFFNMLSNGSNLTSVSHQGGLQIIWICCHYFCQYYDIIVAC